MTKYSPDEKGDQFLSYKGVAPPKRFVHGTEKESDESRKRFRAEHACRWKQRGNEIYCDAGDYEHGRVIGQGRFLESTKDGVPVISERKPKYRKRLQKPVSKG